MSTKTNFKRIALVAVAALGLGVLSSVPAAQAAVSGLTITATNGTAGLQNVRTDSSNAAVIRVAGLMSEDADSATITITQKSVTSGITPLIGIRLKDTNTSTANSTVIDSVAAITSAGSAAAAATGFVYGALNSQSITDSQAVNSISGSANAAGGGGYFRIGAGAANTFVDASFYVQMDSGNSTRVAGTFTGIASVTYWTGLGGATPVAVVQSVEFTITIAAAASASKVANAAYSTAVMSQGTSDAGSTVDSAVSVPSTASNTANAVIKVTLNNVSNAANAQESITATTTIGVIGDGTTMGRSVTLAASAGVNTLQLRADGTAGTAQINISTPNVTFPTKTAVFYSVTAATGTSVKRLNTLATGSNSGAITAVFKDANGNVIGGNTTVYAYSDALTVVSETASACTYDSANTRHTCSLTGVTSGTANITVGTAGKTVVATAIPVTVSVTAPAALKMAWNKTSYAPGEKAFLSVWAVDAAGKPVGSRTIPNLTASGLSTTAGFSGTGTPSIPNSTTSFALAGKIADTDGIDSLEPVYVYTVYMPAAGGTVVVSATGGSSLPVSGQVEVKASATVTDSGAAALAAVTALATTVASLKTLITTLTNLVLKIQKKVKA